MANKKKQKMSKGASFTGKDFLQSKWVKDAESPQTEQRVRERYQQWRERVKDSGILKKAGQLWNYLTSGSVSGKDKAVLVGALLYVISPIDFIPDYIPLAGWFDDIGVAGFALSYIMNKLDEAELDEEICQSPLSSAELSPSTEQASASTISMPQPEESLPYKVDQLQHFAEEMECPDYASMAERVENDLSGTLFRVLFVGRYNSGKTTVINAFLQQDLLPTGADGRTRQPPEVAEGRFRGGRSDPRIRRRDVHPDAAAPRRFGHIRRRPVPR